MLQRCVFLVLVAVAAQSVKISFRNSYKSTIWVGILGSPSLMNGGFVMNALEYIDEEVDSKWNGRFWARTFCNNTKKTCKTGDCGHGIECNGSGPVGPVSVAELKLKHNQKGQDIYSISVTDGFNVKISIEPVGGSGDNTQNSCTRVACEAPINERCPEALKLLSGDQNNSTIGCKSACLAFKSDKYCCLDEDNLPETCPSITDSYASFLKQQCPDACSNAHDCSISTFTCKADSYVITFGN